MTEADMRAAVHSLVMMLALGLLRESWQSASDFQVGRSLRKPSSNERVGTGRVIVLGKIWLLLNVLSFKQRQQKRGTKRRGRKGPPAAVESHALVVSPKAPNSMVGIAAIAMVGVQESVPAGVVVSMVELMTWVVATATMMM
eukprot:4190983-Pleurochrysis_carterae.AAC.1